MDSKERDNMTLADRAIIKCSLRHAVPPCSSRSIGNMYRTQVPWFCLPSMPCLAKDLYYAWWPLKVENLRLSCIWVSCQNPIFWSTPVSQILVHFCTRMNTNISKVQQYHSLFIPLFWYNGLSLVQKSFGHGFNGFFLFVLNVLLLDRMLVFQFLLP